MVIKIIESQTMQQQHVMMKAQVFDQETYLALSRRERGWCGKSLIWHAEIDSTNQALKQLSLTEFRHGVLCASDHQTAGRGQRERKWHSPPGLNLLFSLGFKTESARGLSLLTLAIAYELSIVLEELLSTPVRIKWPNDLYIDGMKVAGILTETVFNGSVLERVIVGVGLNVNQTQFPDDLTDSSTSMAKCSGVEWNRESVLSHLVSSIGKAFDSWSSELERPSLVSGIHHRLLGYGEWVSAEINGIMVGEFKCLGVDAEGRLTLLDQDMNVRSFSHQQIRLFQNAGSDAGRKSAREAERLSAGLAPSASVAPPASNNVAPTASSSPVSDSHHPDKEAIR